MSAINESGYLYDPDTLPDAMLATHAWVEVFLDRHGWLGLDPTHNRVVGALYARIASGRDFTAPRRHVGSTRAVRRRLSQCERECTPGEG